MPLNIKVPRSLQLSVTKRLQDVVKDPKILEEVGQFTQKVIVDNARLGRSIEGTKARPRQLPNLSPGYLARRRKRPEGTDPEFFRPNNRRSNWTFTGQFLKSITFKRVSSGTFRGSIQVFPQGRRRDGQRNVQILRWLTELNRRYQIFGLNSSAERQIRRIVEAGLRRKLRRARRR